MVPIPFPIDPILGGTTKPVLVPVDVAFQHLTDDSAFRHPVHSNSYHLSSNEPSGVDCSRSSEYRFSTLDPLPFDPISSAHDTVPTIGNMNSQSTRHDAMLSRRRGNCHLSKFDPIELQLMPATKAPLHPNCVNLRISPLPLFLLIQGRGRVVRLGDRATRVGRIVYCDRVSTR